VRLLIPDRLQRKSTAAGPRSNDEGVGDRQGDDVIAVAEGVTGALGMGLGADFGEAFRAAYVASNPEGAPLACMCGVVVNDGAVEAELEPWLVPDWVAEVDMKFCRTMDRRSISAM
jgi:hypothetical protein